MPLFKELHSNGTKVCIWQINETLEELEELYGGCEKRPGTTSEARNKEWLASRIALQQATGQHKVEVIKDSYGKPTLNNGIGHISLSHTAKYTAAAFNLEKPVGIDLEKITPRIEKIARRFVHQSEENLIEKNDRLQALYLIWCTKESVFKRYGLKSVDFKNDIQVSHLAIQNKGTFLFESHLEKLKNDEGHYLQFDQHFMVWL